MCVCVRVLVLVRVCVHIRARVHASWLGERDRGWAGGRERESGGLNISMSSWRALRDHLWCAH